jgi:enolase-phosphatase E1
VTGTPAASRARAILLDIEGTLTPVAFVTDVLFPYVRTHLRAHLDAHAGQPEHERLLARLRTEYLSASAGAGPPWADDPGGARPDDVVAGVGWLMDRDVKSTALKELQGRIWEDGYRRGALVGYVFDDVGPALRRWHDGQVTVAIFSSGSVLAQQLLLRHSSSGDLTKYVARHFDTRVGAKGDADSYRRIADEVGLPPMAIVFLSDVTRELDAALAAGMAVRLVVRPGNAPVAPGHGYQVIRSLSDAGR